MNTITPHGDDTVLGETSVGSSDDAAPVADTGRISSLDYIRGLAVMGILIANIIAFGQPANAYIWPGAWIGETGDPEGWMWIAQLILIDGKMRGLFTLLFGAGLYLFMERAWARGASRWLQIWRLVLLLGFGLAHFFFIWMGDILAMYALIGFLVTACLGWKATTQWRVAVFTYFIGALMLGGALTFPYLIAETPFGEVEGLAETRVEMLAQQEATLADDRETSSLIDKGDYGALVEKRLTKQWWMPFGNSLFFFFESFPLMLLGASLYRYGFFSGGVSAGRLRLWGWLGLGIGALFTLGIGLFVKSAGFGFNAATAAIIGWTMIPRFLMTLGLACLLVLYASSASGWLTQRVQAAGRVAFTNYLGTSIVMLFVFHGWALGLFGELNRPQLYLVAILVCLAMLAWSKPWLDRFQYGPLEWLWRCLTYRKLFPLRR